ncbi:hypothetical protein Tco_0938358 [Tanacetum coccineum]|uniref:Uncharacterized protein n=1 Tax=Tanacetum coccineum TaxID=301880 RepID=A0ABQ5DIU3_9ASTR
MKVHKGKRSDHLVDEADEEPQPALEPQVEDDEYNLQRGIQMSLESFQALVDGVAIREPVSRITRQLLVVEGKGKGIATNKQVAQSLLDLQKPKKQTLEERTVELDKGQAGLDTGKTPESRPPPERVLMEEDRAGSNLIQSHVLTTEEHIYIENPPSSSRTLSSMKNLDDAFTFGQDYSSSSSRVYMLENHDLYSKIDKYINEVVKEVVQNVFQAPIHERFRDLSEFEMKDILHDQMFESGSYKSHPEHTTAHKLRAAMSSSKKKSTSPSKQPVDDIPVPDDMHLSESEDTDAGHLPKDND